MLHEVLKLLLRLGYLALEDIELLLFGIVDFIDLSELLLRLDPESLGNIEVIVCLFVVHLVGGQLLLGIVQPYTYLLLVLLDGLCFRCYLLLLQF